MVSSSPTPKFCVGVISVARDNVRYFRTAVGSLLEGLTIEERQEIYLVLFIAHTDPTKHPAYSESWLTNVADKVLTYSLSEDQLEHINSLEQDRGSIREKALFDFTYLLKTCSAVGAPHIIMNEDDVIALDGWYHRTKKALEIAEEKTHLKGSSNFFYLRLFYTEEFLGWNTEEWPKYLFWSLIWVLLPALFLIALRHHIHHHHPSLIKNTPLLLLSNTTTILIISLACIPSCILLFFAAGRVSMLPLPAGINEMPQYGCCMQSLLFPRDRASDLIEWYESKKIGFVDTLAEEFADGNPEERLRWALTPSVMQHVGSKSTKGDDFGTAAKYHRSVAEKLWNFAFELNDRERLREEHLKEGLGVNLEK